MFNPKVLIGAFAVGFLLSLIIGLFSGVIFALVLLRALLSGAGCSFFSIGLSFLIKKFLPEFMEETESDEIKHSDTGSLVDVLVDDDDDLSLDNIHETLYMPASDTHIERQSNENAESVKNKSENDTKDVLHTENTISDTEQEKVSAEKMMKQESSGSALGLDSLPDLDAFIQKSASAAGLGSIEDTLAQDSLVPDAGKTEGVDTQNIVSAIRTILAREK